MLYRCVLIADWLTPGLMGEWCMRAGAGARNAGARRERDDKRK
jgi:hypothetical protein